MMMLYLVSVCHLQSSPNIRTNHQGQWDAVSAFLDGLQMRRRSPLKPNRSSNTSNASLCMYDSATCWPLPEATGDAEFDAEPLRPIPQYRLDHQCALKDTWSFHSYFRFTASFSIHCLVFDSTPRFQFTASIHCLVFEPGPCLHFAVSLTPSCLVSKSLPLLQINVSCPIYCLAFDSLPRFRFIASFVLTASFPNRYLVSRLLPRF